VTSSEFSIWGIEERMNDPVDRPAVVSERAPLDPHVAEGRAQDELEVEEADQHPAVAQQGARILPGNLLRRFFQPASAGEDGYCRQYAEHGLANSRMRRGDGRRQELQYRQAPQDSLKNHASHGSQSETAHPATFIHQPCPNCDPDGQEAHGLGYHAVSVFKLHPADHPRHLVKRAETGGPVGHG
jgi:hypothetical protein